MITAVLDVETSMKPIMHPWQSGAFLTVVGLGTSDGAYKEWWFKHNEVKKEDNLRDLQQALNDVDLLVGHNLKFDLNWLKSKGIVYKGKTWDTMVTEYLLLGQRTYGLDLKTVADDRGCPAKLDVVKIEYWDKGINTNEIPKRILSNYLKGDCKSTYAVYLSQKRDLENKFAYNKYIVNIHNNTLNVLSDIEMNGMPIDMMKINAVGNTYKAMLTGSDTRLRSMLRVKDLNLQSKDELSAALYGGIIKRDDVEEVKRERWATRKVPFTFTYKDGRTTQKTKNEKYRETYITLRNCTKEIHVPGIGFKPGRGSALKKAGYFKTGKEAIKQLTSNTKAKREIKRLLVERAKVAKLVSTILGSGSGTGYMSKIQVDGKMHPRYNNARTHTGRYSSKDPNGQNFSRAKEDQDGFLNPLKTIFMSSQPEGCICAADLAQLEWRVAAFLSQDPVAMHEILSGIDAHLDNAIRFFGDAKFRQDAKIMTFRLLYGGTAYSFFADPLMPSFTLAEWTKIVNNYYQKYHVLRDWQEANILLVQQNNGWYISQFGRLYVFDEHDMTKTINGNRIAFRGFKPTQIKNYEVQGTATGDIMPFAMYILDQRMGDKWPTVKWIGQIHDAILFDCLKTDLKALSDLCIQTFEDLPGLIEKYWGFKFNVPLTGDVEAGPNYGEMKVKYYREKAGGKTLCKKT